jgi:hypothetical protein
MKGEVSVETSGTRRLTVEGSIGTPAHVSSRPFRLPFPQAHDQEAASFFLGVVLPPVVSGFAPGW